MRSTCSPARFLGCSRIYRFVFVHQSEGGSNQISDLYLLRGVLRRKPGYGGAAGMASRRQTPASRLLRVGGGPDRDRGSRDQCRVVLHVFPSENSWNKEDHCTKSKNKLPDFTKMRHHFTSVHHHKH